MKTLIIYVSGSHGNTEKVAKAISKVLKATVRKLDKVKASELKKYDLIGFGSGIFWSSHDRKLLSFVERLPKMKKKAFVFSTAGFPLMLFNHRPLKTRLMDRGFRIAGEFSCPGLDTWGPFRKVGGIRKGRPNRKDLRHAEKFARELKRSI